MNTTAIDGDHVLAAFLSWDDVHRQVRSGQASDAVRRRAMHHPDAQVRGLAAKALDHDATIMTMAAQDSHQTVRLVAARSQATPADVLAVLASDRAVFVRQTLARRPDLDDAICLAMATDNDLTVHKHLAQGPRSTQVLTALLRDGLRAVQHVVLANPHLDHDMAMELTRHGDEFQQTALARSSTNLAVLEALAKNRQPKVRAALVDNPHAPMPLVVAVADRDQALRRRVLRERHADLPREALHRYAEEFLSMPGAELRMWIRRSSGASIAPLAIDEPPGLHDRRQLFEVVDRWLPYDLIADAVEDDSLANNVKAELLAHPDIPVSRLAGFMYSRSPLVREAAARHLRSALYKRYRIRRARR